MLKLKRTHGLGNVALLIHLLEYNSRMGLDIVLYTKKEWADAFQSIVSFKIVEYADNINEIVDLDAETESIIPTEHRINEFAKILKVEVPNKLLKFELNSYKSDVFLPKEPYILLSLDANHPSRELPIETQCELINKLTKTSQVVLVGENCRYNVSDAVIDLRQATTVSDLLFYIFRADKIITMDSAALHLSSLFNIRTIAIFGGIDYNFRLFPRQMAIPIFTNLDCYPCNKNEVCNSRYDCVKNVSVDKILNLLCNKNSFETIQRPSPASRS